MIYFEPGNRVRVKHRPEAGYTWTAMWGKVGTVQHYDWSSSTVWVLIDNQSFAFMEDEIEKVSVLELMIE